MSLFVHVNGIKNVKTKSTIRYYKWISNKIKIHNASLMLLTRTITSESNKMFQKKGILK